MAVAVSPSNSDTMNSYCKDSDPSNNATLKTNEKEDLVSKKELLGQLQSIQQIKSKKIHRKRRHSTTEAVSNSTHSNAGKGFIGKHRRPNTNHSKKGYAGDIILPTKFLLGGNISDPLNLNSMLDENINRAVNAVTPSSSPLPPRSSKINIVIPSDMTDPLGLNLSQDEDEKLDNSCTEDAVEQLSESLEPKLNLKKRKRRRKSQHEKLCASKDDLVSEKYPLDNADLLNSLNQKETSKLTQKTIKIKKINSRLLEIEPDIRPPSIEKKHTNLTIAVPQLSSVVVDPIVSPVIPQDVKRNAINQLSKSKKRKSTSNPPGKMTHSSSIEVSKVESTVAKHNTNLLTTHKENTTNDRLVCEIKAARLFSDISKSEKVKESSVAKCSKQYNSSSAGQTQTKFKPSNTRFQYGNYSQYYGYRNPQKFNDVRMNHLKKEWFKEKDVLDVGCNAGHLTLLIARDYSPRKIVGVDIDEGLINMARKNVRHYSTAETRPTASKASKYPDSMPVMYGSIVGPPLETGQDDLAKFPNNIIFLQGNYVPEKDEVLQCQEPEYDVILCMSVTKWMHLNWGDEGLKNTFQRFYKQLRPGGKLILEPQEWKSYGKKKKLTETIYTNYNSIKFKPQMFSQYLISEVGFEKVDFIKLPEAKTKGFQRPIHLYYKPE